MRKKKEHVCRKQKIGDIFEIECGESGKDSKKMYCVLGTKGKSGGASGFGFGGQYGVQGTAFECFSEDELVDKVAKKLGVDKENIKWVEEK